MHRPLPENSAPSGCRGNSQCRPLFLSMGNQGSRLVRSLRPARLPRAALLQVPDLQQSRRLAKVQKLSPASRAAIS